MMAGKDGYTVLLDESIEKLPPVHGEHDPTIQQIFINFFRNFRKGNWAIMGLAPRSRKIFEDRIHCFHTKISNRDDKLKAIKLNPQIEKRVENIREPIKHED